MGDPAGIGPEVALKAVASFPARVRSRFLMLGKASFYQDLARAMRTRLDFEDVADPTLPASREARVRCYFPGDFKGVRRRGRSDDRLTEQAVRSIELAVQLAMKGCVRGIVTPPINKAGLRQAGFDIPGHTEYLAALSGVRRYEMMLVGGPLRVVLVTRHLPLKDVPKAITAKKVEATILLTVKELRRSFGIDRPRIVVCGLNPHAGESGHIGREEISVILPGVKRARRKTTAEITGPLSPDALFHDAYTGRYDAEICMYHDQGLIPLKMISRGAGVNVTLGLPFVRTSPDHGTGYDIADRFTADAGSMTEAILLADQLSSNRRRFDGRLSRA